MFPAPAEPGQGDEKLRGDVLHGGVEQRGKWTWTGVIAAEWHGMGIDLKVCQSLVEAHAGTIRTLPDLRSGAAFEIQLPIAVANNDPV